MSITLNPGVGGPVVASDIHNTEHYQLLKMSGNNADFWPNYRGAESVGPSAVNVDSGGALITRGAVTTDEGTFRANFANTSIAVPVGNVTLTNGSNLVSWTLTDTTDLHKGDYIKLDADAASAWVQIESILSDSSGTLVESYTGTGGTGAASRAIVKPITIGASTVSVASGQCTLVSGTVSGDTAVLVRQLDYAPIVWRGALSISQRIANQSTRFGLVEDATTARYFARFRAEGTVNTVIVCETGRNPTTAPSAAETQSTTVTLPDGLTTAILNEYRVEQLTESVRFYVNNRLVAEHSKVIPLQSDVMGSGVLITNTATAASSTSVVVDYLTGKNHNKLEVGIMSNNEQVIAAAPVMETRTFTQAGVIAVNTVLMTIDCSQVRSISIHSVSMGTTGVVTPEFSNDGTNWLTATLRDQTGATSTTFNAGALLRTVAVQSRFFRLRLSTATTAGTTTIVATTWQTDVTVTPVTQPVSGTVTANIGTGSIAAGTNAIGDVGLQVRANATGAATTSHLVSAATTNAANIKNAAGRVLGWSAVNTTGVFQYVKLHNSATAPTAGAGVFMTIAIPPNSVNNCPPTLPGIAFSAGIGRTIVTGSADTDATATTAGAVIFDLFYA